MPESEYSLLNGTVLPKFARMDTEWADLLRDDNKRREEYV